jgi:hypothetical protein
MKKFIIIIIAFFALVPLRAQIIKTVDNKDWQIAKVRLTVKDSTVLVIYKDTLVNPAFVRLKIAEYAIGDTVTADSTIWSDKSDTANYSLKSDTAKYADSVSKDSIFGSIKVGMADDTTIIKSNGTINQYYNATQVFKTTITGDIENSVLKTSGGTKTSGYFYTGTGNPTNTTTRLNFDGNLYTTSFTANGALANCFQGLNLSSSSTTVPTLNVSSNNNPGIYITQGSVGTGVPFTINSGGSTDLTILNPFTLNTGTSYFFRTKNYMTTGLIFDIRNQNNSIFSIKKDTLTGDSLNAFYKSISIGGSPSIDTTQDINTVTFDTLSSDNFKLNGLSIGEWKDIFDLKYHFNSVFMDSSRVIELTKDTPIQITNTHKNLWPNTELLGFTESGDTAINTYAGGYDIKFEYNANASVAADFKYYVKRKSGITTSTVYSYVTSNAGSTVERMVGVHVHLLAGDRIYIQVENVTNSNDITVYGGSFLIELNHF